MQLDGVDEYNIVGRGMTQRKSAHGCKISLLEIDLMVFKSLTVVIFLRVWDAKVILADD